MLKSQEFSSNSIKRSFVFWDWRFTRKMIKFQVKLTSEWDNRLFFSLLCKYRFGTKILLSLATPLLWYICTSLAMPLKLPPKGTPTFFDESLHIYDARDTFQRAKMLLKWKIWTTVWSNWWFCFWLQIRLLAEW